MSVPGWPVAFRGSAAVAAGSVTKDVLRGPRFERLFPDTYVRAGTGPPDLLPRSHAAHRYVAGRGVLSGFSAAEVLDASCGPVDAPAEVTVPNAAQRPHPGLVVHRDRPAVGETTVVDGIRCTRPPRTAWDLARRGGLVERAVGVDAPARRHCFDPDLLIDFLVRYPGARGNDVVPEVLALADRCSGSPMETRLRLLLVLAGLPRPRTQWVVQDPRRRRAVRLDLAHPGHRIGIEYDGAGHAAAAGCAGTSGGSPISSTSAGGSTATPRKRSTVSPTASWRRSAAPSPHRRQRGEHAPRPPSRRSRACYRGSSSIARWIRFTDTGWRVRIGAA